MIISYWLLLLVLAKSREFFFCCLAVFRKRKFRSLPKLSLYFACRALNCFLPFFRLQSLSATHPPFLSQKLHELNPLSGCTEFFEPARAAADTNDAKDKRTAEMTHLSFASSLSSDVMESLQLLTRPTDQDCSSALLAPLTRVILFYHRIAGGKKPFQHLHQRSVLLDDAYPIKSLAQ